MQYLVGYDMEGKLLLSMQGNDRQVVLVVSFNNHFLGAYENIR